LIPVNVYSLSLTHVQNTGAILAYKSSVVISPSNLTFATNADDPSLELTFKVRMYKFKNVLTICKHLYFVRHGCCNSKKLIKLNAALHLKI